MDCPEEKVQLIAKEDKESKETKQPEEPKKKEKKRCHECRSKLSLIVYTCKCNHIFCHRHLNAHSHNCKYNYTKEIKKQIEMNNPKIGSKIKESI